MKVKTSKGFTLAEMLIVMAVVVVLAAAAMPAVANQVETARESIDVDTIRAAYSEAYTRAYMTYMNGETLTSTGYPITIALEQKTAKWQGNAPKIAGIATTGDPAADTNTVTFVFVENDTSDGIKLSTATLSKV